MSGHSVPIDFWVEKEKVSDPAERENMVQGILPLVSKYCSSLQKITSNDLADGNYFYLYASSEGTLSIKMYKEGLISSTLEYIVTSDSVNIHRISNDDGRRIERELVAKFGCGRVKVLPALKRAPLINPYFTSSDDRILEYDVDSLLFEERSEFQKIQIFHTKSYGNILVLDDLQNLAESDLEYTQALMNKKQEQYKDKEVLILGGGDGALLWELLKEEPKFVTMIDIDEGVIRGCRQFMRSVCGDCMDNYDGKNYKVIIGDAIAYLRDYLKEGRKFDFVIGDLTDIPLTSSTRGPLWDFIREIINLGVQVLRPSGKYMTHAIGIQCEKSLELFETQLKNLVVPVTFSRTNSHVPSFMENWCFYQVSPKI